MIELSTFDSRITEHQDIIVDRLSNWLFSLSKSNSDAVLFKSIEGCAIPTKSNLTVCCIANSVSLENLNDDEKIAKFLRYLCFSDNEKSPHWKEQRMGRLTASKHHDVYTKVNTIARYKLHLWKLILYITLKLSSGVRNTGRILLRHVML